MKITRRDLIKSGAAASAVVASGATVAGCGNEVSPAPIADFEVGTLGLVSVELARYPDLDPPGRHVGALTLRLHWPDNAATFSVLLVQWAQGQFLASKAECPHKGCPLGFSASDVLIECPCHDSRFAVQPMKSSDGKRTWCVGDFVHGPAATGLTLFSPVLASGFVTIDLSDAAQIPGSATSCTNLKRPLPTSGNTVTLPFTVFPELMMPGGQVIGVPQVMPPMNPILVARRDATHALAIDALCTHQGCPVAFVLANNDLECPCHGSTYALDGTVTNPPALSSLTPYAATVTATGITVTLA